MMKELCPDLALFVVRLRAIKQCALLACRKQKSEQVADCSAEFIQLRAWLGMMLNWGLGSGTAQWLES